MDIDLARHEKKAFFKFFITYFISVGALIVVAGYFYFLQTKNHLLKEEEFSLIEYARHIKTGENLDSFGDRFWYTFVETKGYVDIRNFQELPEAFTKILPIHKEERYLRVFKKKDVYEKKLQTAKTRIIGVQVVLLILFAIISYFLAINALKPLQKSIDMLDKFAKDLIHDLNTPVTSIKLNLKILKKDPVCAQNKALRRLDRSVYDISELYENLTVLLEEETFLLETIDVCEVIHSLFDTFRVIYPDLRFITQCRSFQVRTNPSALKQLLQNILSNACKYNKPGGYVKVYAKKTTLYIEDSGKGIEEPDKIFKRHYSLEASSGIGLDIVRRLAHAMGIAISVTSDESGSTFAIAFDRGEAAL